MTNSSMGLLIALGFIGVTMIEPIVNEFDNRTTRQPWFDVEISEGDGGIIYTRDIARWLKGDWVATVQVKEDSEWVGVCAGDGTFIYRPKNSGTIKVTFEYFTGGCSRPEDPSRVCVDYVMTDRRDRTRDFGPFCTASRGKAR